MTSTILMNPSNSIITTFKSLEQLCFSIGHSLLVSEDDSGELIFISENFKEALQITSNTLPENTDEYYLQIHPNDRFRVKHAYQRVAKEHNIEQVSFRFQVADDKTEWIESTIFPLQISDSPTLYIAISNKPAAKSPFKDTVLYHVEDIAHVGGWEWFPEENIFLCSDEVFKISEVLPSSVSEKETLQIFPQNVQDKLAQAAKNAIETNKKFQLELPFETGKGNQIWVRIIGKPIKAKHTAKKFSGTLQDITKEKEAAIELEKAKRKAEEAARAQEVFLSTMSHEIRTPMNAVIGFSHQLLEEKPAEHQISRLRNLKSSAENLRVLIDDILDFNKLESGQFMFEEIPFDLREVAESIKEGQLLKAQEKGIKLKLKLDSDIPQNLIGDKTRISQVLNNLVNNAVKFTEEGGVTIDIEVKETHLETIDILFAVKDTGIGIEADKIESIFKRFIQANPETSRKYGGTGLGLAITKGIVELMGGQIAVESVVNEGSIFSFMLTFHLSDEINEPKKAFEQNNQNLSGAKILLVEDNKINQLVVKNYLEKWNTRLTIANNGKEGFELIMKAQEFDLVLMDLEMPLMNGYETTEALRAQKGKYFSNLPILALTASAIQNVRNKVRAVGMNDYISKPFHPSEFFQKIHFYLQTPEEQELSKEKPPELPNFSQDGLVAIINGSEAFFDQFVEMTESSLVEFCRAYEICLPEFNLRCIRENSHKLKATLKLIGANALMAEIERGKQLAKDRSTPILLIDQSVMRVKGLCDVLINELKSQKQVLLKGTTSL